jgi:hypothetical protein
MRAAMGKRIKFLVVLAMLALVPLRAVAALTIGLCAMSDENAATVQVHAGHGHAHPHAESAAAETQKDSKAPCNLCAEHCGSAAFAVPAHPSPLVVTAGSQRAVPRHLLLPRLTPEELDRPPIVL